MELLGFVGLADLAGFVDFDFLGYWMDLRSGLEGWDSSEEEDSWEQLLGFGFLGYSMSSRSDPGN